MRWIHKGKGTRGRSAFGAKSFAATRGAASSRWPGSPDDTTAYPNRYQKWRDAFGPQSAPALGESLIVTRRSAEPVRGTFRGFADRWLLFATADSCVFLMLRLDKHVSVRRAADPAMDSDWI